MNFDIKTTYNYLTFIDDYTFEHYCFKNKCITCPFPDACVFLSNFLKILERTIDKEEIV